MDRINHIIEQIKCLESLDDEANLEALDQALQELGQAPEPARGMEALFGVFERFPESDGYGLCWQILHMLERLPVYEIGLIESVQRQPTQFTLRMINRLLHGGVTHVASYNLRDLLAKIAGDQRYPDAARAQAQHYLERQQNQH